MTHNRLSALPPGLAQLGALEELHAAENAVQVSAAVEVFVSHPMVQTQALPVIIVFPAARPSPDRALPSQARWLKKNPNPPNRKPRVAGSCPAR